jgi:hypothetical protein
MANCNKNIEHLLEWSELNQPCEVHKNELNKSSQHKMTSGSTPNTIALKNLTFFHSAYDFQ